MEAAKAARKKANDAAVELHKEKAKLEILKAKADKAGEARLHPKKKSTALKRLKGAEEQLVQDMKNKLRGAKGDLQTMLQALHDMKLREAEARQEAEKKKNKLGDLNDKLGGAESEFKRLEVNLKTVEGKIMTERKVHFDISMQMQEASAISIPEHTPVEDVKRLLEEKEAKLRKLTAELLAQIKKEKDNVDKKHQMMIKQKKLQDAIVTDQNQVSAATAESQA